MNLLGESRVGGSRLVILVGVLSFALLTVMAMAARARATETIYWDNYEDRPATVGSAGLDGNGGGLLNLAGLTFETTEGMAYDPVTNRLFIAAEKPVGGSTEGVIVYVNLDGSGAGFFAAPGLVTKGPEGIVVDPATRMLYWDNTETGSESIGWAKLDGSAAGLVNIDGAATKGFYRLALDPGSGRLYWVARNAEEKEIISWASVSGTGGGILPGAPNEEGIDGLATDVLNGRLYMVGTKPGGTTTSLQSVPLAGGTFESVPLTAGADEPYGLAIDPVSGTAYWGNYGVGETGIEAIGRLSLATATSTPLSITTTRVNGPQDPVIVRSPTGTGAPQITQSKAALSCTQGSWAPDYAGGFVYQAPVSYSYQWLVNGQAIAGATSNSYTAGSAGSYSCAVTGKNPSGSVTQTSTAAATVTPAAFVVSSAKKKVKVKAGKTASIRLQVANGGDVSSPGARLCATLNKKAKKGLVAPQCAALSPVASGAASVAVLKVRTKKTARGAYKFSASVEGVAAQPVTVTVQVKGAKRKHRKHHKK